MRDFNSFISDGRISSIKRANLARLLAPKSMAFIGGSQCEYTLNTLREQAYMGDVYVVHPKRDQIAGYRCLRSIADLPVAPDCVFLAVNADLTITALAQLSAMGAGGVVCYASGFSEVGDEARNAAFIAAAGDMAVVGPNCYGLVNYVNHGSIWPGPYPALKSGRGAAVISQSGNVTGHIVSNSRSVPYSYLISAGNQAVLGFEDYIDYLIDDPNVTCIGLFMEGIRDVVGFSQACIRARAHKMPVIICRSGRSELGAVMAASHTSSLAGHNTNYATLFDRLGVITTDTVPQFLEMMKLASLAPDLSGDRICVFSSSGGDNGLAADYCSFAGLNLAQPNADQIATIRPMLPEFGHVSNPLDFTAGYWGQENLLTPMFTTMLQGDYDAGLLVIDYPNAEAPAERRLAHQAMDRALCRAGKASAKPVFHASVNTEAIPPKDAADLMAQGIVPLNGLHDAAEVIGKWARYRRSIMQDQDCDLSALLPWAIGPIDEKSLTLNEANSKKKLASFGLNIPDGQILTRLDLANLPDVLPNRAVLKVLHDALAHKTEVGGVTLNLTTRAEVEAAAAQMTASVARHRPDVDLDTFLLEPMAHPPLAELIVGVKRDALFGLVLVIGAGGILVELLNDAASFLLPVRRADIEIALRGLKVFTLLNGFRGRPVANLEPIIDAIMAIAEYASVHRNSLLELDVNPLMIYENGVLAVDALIIEQPS